MQWKNRNIRIRKLLLFLSGIVLALGCVEQLHAAGTPAGTVIRARSLGTYTFQGGVHVDTVYSNYVSTVVQQYAAVNLIPPAATRNSQSDSTFVDFPLLVVNGGNAPDIFDLSAVSSRGWFEGIYLDGYRDGVLQSSEVLGGKITVTSAVPADSSYALIVRIFVPRDPSLSGQQDTTGLTVTSRFNTSRFQKGYYVTAVNTAFPSPRTLLVDNVAPYQDQDVVFTFALTNSGAGAANNVIITDILAAQFSYVSASAGVTRPASDIVRWTIPLLAAGASQTFTVTVHIPALVPVGTVINNIIGIVYGVGSNTFSVSSNMQRVTVTQNPIKLYDLTLAPVQWTLQKDAGDTVIVALVAKNIGARKDVIEMAATSGDTAVTWNFYLDANRNGQFDITDRKLQNTNGFAGVDADSVVSGDSVRIFATTAKPLPRVQFDQTDIVSTFTVSSSGNPSVSKSAVLTTTILIPVVSVSIGVSPAARYAPGDSVTYTITYQNDGHAKIDSFSVVNIVPAETQYLAGSVSVNGIVQQDSEVIVAETPGHATVRARVGALSPNQHGTVTYRARIK